MPRPRGSDPFVEATRLVGEAQQNARLVLSPTARNIAHAFELLCRKADRSGFVDKWVQLQERLMELQSQFEARAQWDLGFVSWIRPIRSRYRWDSQRKSIL